MGKFFGKGNDISSIFNLKEGVTTASSLSDYNFSSIKSEIKNELDSKPIIFISDSKFGNLIWANELLFGVVPGEGINIENNKISASTISPIIIESGKIGLKIGAGLHISGSTALSLNIASGTVLGGIKTDYPETARTFPVNLDNDNRAYVDLTNLTVSGRNLAIRKTATLRLTLYYSLNEYYQTKADTAGNVFRLYITTVVSPTDITSIQNIYIQDITAAGFYSFTVKLNDFTLYIRIKHNGVTSDGPDIIYTLPYIISPGTYITISLKIVSVTNAYKVMGNIKIEEGRIATAFTMAPEDILVGGANLILPQYEYNLNGYSGTSISTTSYTAAIAEFNKTASDKYAISITTTGGTSTLKTFLECNFPTTHERDLIYSIWVKNTGSTSVIVGGYGIESSRLFQTVPAGTAAKLVFVLRQTVGRNVQIHFMAKDVSDSLSFIIWHPMVLEGNVPSGYHPIILDTKVTQTPTSSNVAYNLLTTTAARSSTAITDTAYFNTKLTYNPSTATLKNDGCSQVYDSTNKCLKFVFA